MIGFVNSFVNTMDMMMYMCMMYMCVICCANFIKKLSGPANLKRSYSYNKL